MINIFSHYYQFCLFILIKGSIGIKTKPSLKVLINDDIKQSKPIKLKDFSEHYRIMSADSNFQFSKEYEELKRVGRDKPCTAADMPVNQPKNRYSDILPYDHSR
jgi:receptor-type tyrosine-protein phosphatase beta